MKVPVRLARNIAAVSELTHRRTLPGADRVILINLLKDVQILLNGITDIHRESSFRIEDPRNPDLFEYGKRNAATHLGAFAWQKGLMHINEVGIDPPVPEIGRQGMRQFRFSMYALTPEALLKLRTGVDGEVQSIFDLIEGEPTGG